MAASASSIGSCLSRAPTVFDAVSKLLFVCSGCQIKVYAVETGHVLHVLAGHTADVTSVALHPTNSLQLLSSSQDGTVRVWDYEDEQCLGVHEVGLPVLCMAVSSAAPSVCYLLLASHSKGADDAPDGGKKGKKGKKGKSKKGGQGTDAGNDVETGGKQQWAKPTSRLVAWSLEQRALLRVIARGKRPQPGTAAIVTRLAQPDSGTALHATPSGGADGAAAPSAAHFVATVLGRRLVVWHSASCTLSKHTHTRRLTALALHPSDPWVATGDEEGQINRWRCLTDGAADEAPSTEPLVSAAMHWHSSGVTCLSYSTDGSLLLSGGNEGVLVLWQLATGAKDFLPRLGAPLTTIAVSPQSVLFAVACADNSLRLIDAATLDERWRAQGLAFAHTARESAAGAADNVFVVEPRAGAIVLNGTPGSAALQFFDAAAERHVLELQVEQRNTVSRSQDADTASCRVEQVCFSACGARMATFDTNRPRKGEKQPAVASSSLKFWAYSGADNCFVLQAVVESPHQDVVSSLAYHPRLDLVVSGSHDGTFKVWQRAAPNQQVARGGGAVPDEHDAAATGAAWSCRSVGAYRDLPVRSVAFSDDGSLLAAACGHVVTLWDAVRNVFRTALVQPPQADAVISARFLPHTQYLVVATGRSVLVWDLLSLSVWWSYQLACTALAVAPSAGCFAVATHEHAERGRAARSFVLVFEAANAVPRQVVQLACPAQAVAIAPREQAWNLLVLSKRREVSSIPLNAGARLQLRQVGDGSIAAKEEAHEAPSSASAFSAFAVPTASTAPRAGAAPNSAVPVAALRVADAELSALFDAPSHTLPPLSDLVGPFMQNFLPLGSDAAGAASPRQQSQAAAQQASRRAQQQQQQQQQQRPHTQSQSGLFSQAEELENASAFAAPLLFFFKDLLGLKSAVATPNGKKSSSKVEKRADGDTQPDTPSGSNSSSSSSSSSKKKKRKVEENAAARDAPSASKSKRKQQRK